MKDDDQVQSEREELGLRLRKARKACDMTQLDVAAKFRVGKQTVSAWETGYGLPDPLRLVRLARLYGASVDGLLGVADLSDEARQLGALFDTLDTPQRNTVLAMVSALVKKESSADDQAAPEPAVIDRRRVQSGRRQGDLGSPLLGGPERRRKSA